MSRYENHKLEDKEIPFIYKQDTILPTKGIPRSSNWHENIELVYVIGGSGIVSNNGHPIHVEKGDVVVINANHLHSLSAIDETLLYRYLIVDRSFCLANCIDSSALSFETHIKDHKLQEIMEELHAAYTTNELQYRSLTVRSVVLRIMTLLCNAYSAPLRESLSPDRTVSYVKQAITYIRASFDKDFSLDDVADFVGVNKCYLSREFHKYTGYPFVAYVNLTRCKMACRLLSKERLSISEVGQRCGFPNRSYFAKCFKRYIGVLPAEYRRNIFENG